MGEQSPGQEQYPRGPDHQEHGQEEESGQQAHAVEFALCEVTAADEDDVLASALWRNYREVAAGEEQRERH